jgi:hypothetical protein
VQAPQGLEYGTCRYFVAVADAGSFTHAAERIFIAQATLSQQIRRLEQIVGTLLHRRREGLRLTTAGGVPLDASRNVLSLVEHEVSRTRQAAGLGRPRLRAPAQSVALPGCLSSSVTAGRGGECRGHAVLPVRHENARPRCCVLPDRGVLRHLGRTLAPLTRFLHIPPNLRATQACTLVTIPVRSRLAAQIRRQHGRHYAIAAPIRRLARLRTNRITA